jgi:4a-hydroxytetrahydrobiopterin dehydratase
MKGERQLNERRVLADSEIEAKLKELPGWTYGGGYLTRHLVFRSFTDALSFMVRCAFEIERLNHHPDWCNVYNRLDIKLQTHEAGGVTELDIELAGRMNSILSGYSLKQ